MPKVTIAIPTYNRQEYLKECLGSILHQTFHDFEILVFDNGSDYDIQGLINTFRDPRILLHRNPVNLGHHANFKKVYSFPFQTAFVNIFFDDDVMHPQLLERELEAFDAFPKATMVAAGTNFVHQGQDIGSFAKFTGKPKAQHLPNKAALCRLILQGFNLCFDSVMYRSEILEDIFPFQSFEKWGDRPYLLHLSAKGGVAVLKEKLVNYRIHPGQDSQSSAADELVFIFKLFDFYKNSLPQPLSLSDNKLFKSWATNNAILSASSFAKNFGEYKKVLKVFQQKGFFAFRYVKFKGLWYLLKAIKKITGF